MATANNAVPQSLFPALLGVPPAAPGGMPKYTASYLCESRLGTRSYAHVDVYAEDREAAQAFADEKITLERPGMREYTLLRLTESDAAS